MNGNYMNERWNIFLHRLKNIYSLDIRALGLMRIAFSLLLITDLCIRFSSLEAHYTIQGVVPFKAVELSFWKKGFFSLFELSDQYGFALLFFVLTSIIYTCLLLGYKTKLVSLLSWLMLVSLQNRNTLVNQGGDDLMRMLLFWGIFLPWGNYYAIDAKKKTGCETSYLDIPALGYISLLFSVYFFTGVLKHSPEWESEGTALYYALSLDQMTWPLGKSLLHYPSLLKAITLFVRWLEVLAPFLLFIPFQSKICRLIFIGLIAALHVGIACTLFVGLFWLVGIISLIGLLSASVMNKFDTIIKRKNNLYHEAIQNFFQKLANDYYFKLLKNCFLFFCIALSLIWNIGTVNGSGLAVSDSFSGFGYALRLDQNWGMFAPTVFKDDGWFIFEGTKADSTKIDINVKGAHVTYAKPENILSRIKDDRWRKYQENVLFTNNDFIRPYYCRWLLRKWNEENPSAKILNLKIIYMKEISGPPGEKQTATKEILCGC